MYCACTGGGRRGFRCLAGLLWVCENCDKPTRLVFKKWTNMRAPRGAVALLSVHGRADDVNEITFVCEGGERKMVLEVAGHTGVLERLWAELDATMDTLMNLSGMEGVDEHEVALLRVKARTQGETLLMFTYPFFTSIEEISREAKLRYNARKKGEVRETPGLAGEEYAPPADNRRAQDSQETERKPASRRSSRSSTRTGKKLPAEALPTIKQALETKMFTVAQIAKSYGVTEEEVKEQVGLA